MNTKGPWPVLLLFLLSALTFGSPAACRAGISPPVDAPEVSGTSDDRMHWWRDARFGMFIHWGLYAIPAGQWSDHGNHGEWIMSSARIPVEEYERYRERFNPVRFDANAWVALAKAAGMRYIVITTKHHDGFCLFDSGRTDHDVMSTPFKRDIMRELSDACAREGLRMCWYYSIMDWHHPDYLPRRDWETRPVEGASFDRYIEYMKGQLRELLTNYGPIGVMWFDGQWEGTWNNDRGRAIHEYCRALQPGVIINNRVGRAGGDFGLDASQGVLGDFGTPEQVVPATGIPGVDWESCMTMNDHWGYNKTDKNFKSTRTLVRMLVDIASKGGNLLLNVGPDAQGEIPPESVERLREIGEWMSENGESIRGTSAGPFPSLAWGRCTRRTMPEHVTRLYLHVFDWPADRRLVVPGILNRHDGVSVLGDSSAAISVKRHGDDLVISLPEKPRSEICTVVTLDVRGEPDVMVPPRLSAFAPVFIDRCRVGLSSDQASVEFRATKHGEEVTADSPLVGSEIELEDTTTLRVRAYRGNKAVSPEVAATFERVTPRPSEDASSLTPGLRFECVEGDFKVLPEFDGMSAARSGDCAGFDTSVRTREKYFAVRYRGFIGVPEDGVYRFFVRSDDGSRLWIGDRLVVDNDGLHSSHEKSGVIALSAGLHPITAAFFEATGGFDFSVAWQSERMPRRSVVPGDLYREE